MAVGGISSFVRYLYWDIEIEDLNAYRMYNWAGIFV